MQKEWLLILTTNPIVEKQGIGWYPNFAIRLMGEFVE